MLSWAIAGIGLVVLAFVAFWISEEVRNGFVEGLCMCVVVISVIVSVGTLIFVLILGYGWQAAKFKADIINREYKTNYTQEEIFYASDAIDTIKQLDRQRIEINGNLLQKQ